MAGEGEQSRLRVGPYVPESGGESGGSAEPDNAVTQFMPVVRREPVVVDAPTVRAVARRVPSALPALGGAEGPREVPPSTQATVDRRRRAKQARDSSPHDPEPSAESGTESPITESMVTESMVTESMVAESAATPAAGVAEAATVAERSLPEGSVPYERAPEEEVASWAFTAAPMTAAPMTAAPMTAAPMASGPVTSGPMTTEPITPGPITPEPLIAEVVDDEPAPAARRRPQVRAVVDANEIELPAATRTRDSAVAWTGVPHGDAQTDEWVGLAREVADAAPDGAAGSHVGIDGRDADRTFFTGAGGDAVDSGGAGSDGASSDGADSGGAGALGLGRDDERDDGSASGIGELVRPGPSVLDADSWETEPEDSRNESYHGRRRAPAAARRLWLTIGLVLAGLGTAIAAPMALSSSSEPAGAPLVVDSTSQPFVPAPETEVLSSTSAPAETPTARLSSRPVVVATQAPTSPRPTNASPFVPVTLQAEAATLEGSAETTTNPCGIGGVIAVREVGDWEQGRNDEDDGRIVFKPVSVPAAGKYVMTVHYLMSRGSARTLVVKVNGASSAHTFPAAEDCEMQTRQVTLTLGAGSQTIELGNPDGRAPTIDKVVITRP